MLRDYTLQLIQSMAEQGATTVEYELKISQIEARELAGKISTDGSEITFPSPMPESNLLRMVYVTKNNTIASDGRQLDIHDRADIINAFNREAGVY